MLSNNSDIPMKVRCVDTKKEIILERGDNLDVLDVIIKDGITWVKLKNSYLIYEEQCEFDDIYLKG